MKLVTWNVNGIRAYAQKGFEAYVQSEAPDILCLQETKAHPDQVEDAVRELEGYQSWWSTAYKKGYSGTVIFSKIQPKEVRYGIGIRQFDSEGRFVVAEYDDFIVYNVYFPNGASGTLRHNFKQEFLGRYLFHLKMEMKKGKPIVLVGDYNIAPDEIDVYDPKGLAGISGFLPEERQWFNDFKQAGFTDTFRHFHADEKEVFSWWPYQGNARRKNQGWRIDHICTTEKLVSDIKDVVVQMNQLGSDHCPVMMEM